MCIRKKNLCRNDINCEEEKPELNGSQPEMSDLVVNTEKEKSVETDYEKYFTFFIGLFSQVNEKLYIQIDRYSGGMQIKINNVLWSLTNEEALDYLKTEVEKAFLNG